MATVRSYPNINFVNTNTDKLVNSLIKSYEMFTGRTLYPADPARLFILWLADIMIQERVIINESAKQNVPRYAEGKNLDSLAEIFKDAYRLEAQAAKTTFRFYLSTKLPTQQIVPSGTRITVDGKITFQTLAHLFIEAGSMYGDIAAECQTIGTEGNGFVPGQIIQLVDPFPFYERVENITESAGGAAEESDTAFYERMRESMESFSTAGPAGAYIYHAKTASPLVADVSATSPERGVADVRVLLKNSELPTEEVLKKVKDALTADKTRPLADFVTISAPDIMPFDIEAKYFLSKNGASSAEVIAIEIENAVGEYIKWQTEKMGRDINPSYLISLLMRTGVKRVEVTKPLYTTIDRGMVAVLNASEVINGGVEDE